MTKLKIYLDNCCYNRPFDDQSQLLTRLETQAVLFILERVKAGDCDLVWSYILDLESEAHPHPRRRKDVQQWKTMAVSDIEESDVLLLLMESFEQRKLKSADALHLASAVMAEANFFITVDRGILNKPVSEIRVVNPEQFVRCYAESQFYE